VTQVTIYVVDDEPMILAIAVRALERHGWVTRAFPTADAAQRSLDEDDCPAELVLTDCSMPGSIDGFGLARWLADCRPGLPVVMMSGAVESLAIAWHIRGVEAVLAKPFDFAELRATIAYALLRLRDRADLPHSGDIADPVRGLWSRQGDPSL
jgi:DNA-binding response OmpR family regulator